MNKNCLEEEDIWDYIDGELEMNKYCTVRSHLEKCPNCKDKYQEIRSFNSHLVVGFEQNLFACEDDIPTKTSFDHCVNCSTHEQKWAGLWQKLLVSNVAAFCSAFILIIFFSPNVDGLFCISELCVIRESVLSLLHL